MAVWIQNFKVFQDLVKTKSFRLTAKRNNLSQSAVSQQLHLMERELKSRLAERTAWTFRLTREGQIFYDYAQKIVRTYNNFNEKFWKSAQNISNTLRVSTTPCIGFYDLQSCLRQFQKEHAQANLVVKYCRANQIYDDVSNGAADLGLVSYPVRRNPDLKIMPLKKEPMVLICHPQHPFAKGRTVKMGACTRQTFIRFTQGPPTIEDLDRIMVRRRIKKRRIIEFNDLEPIKRAVEIGLGVAIVPEITVRQKVAKQTLAALPIADRDFYRPLAAIRRKNMPLSPILERFLALMKKAV